MKRILLVAALVVIGLALLLTDSTSGCKTATCEISMRPTIELPSPQPTATAAEGEKNATLLEGGAESRRISIEVKQVDDTCEVAYDGERYVLKDNVDPLGVYIRANLKEVVPTGIKIIAADNAYFSYDACRMFHSEFGAYAVFWREVDSHKVLEAIIEWNENHLTPFLPKKPLPTPTPGMTPKLPPCYSCITA